MLQAVIVVVGCVLGVLLGPNRPAPAETAVAAADHVDSVQIERRLILVEAVVAQPSTDLRPRAAPRVAPVTKRVASAAKRTRGVQRSHTSPEPFVVRATRLVLGDGRFRPEPFPHVK
jgi:hypothetical protein